MLFTRLLKCPQFSLAVLLLLVSIGCGSGGLSASGTVTYDGKPVDEGSITFEPVDGVGPSEGAKIENGKFVIEGGNLTPGKKKVVFVATMKTGRQVQAGAPAPAGMMIDEAIYINAAPQEFEIVKGQTQDLSFTVTEANPRKR